MKRKIVTSDESIREQKRQHPHFKPEVTPEIAMIVPGRRALGEDWVEVTIGHDADMRHGPGECWSVMIFHP